MSEFRAYAPSGIAESELYKVTLFREGSAPEELYVASATVANRFTDYTKSYEKMAFCSFDYDFDSPVRITVEPKRQTHEAVIMPKSAVKGKIYSANKLTFVLEEPTKLSCEFDGNLYHNLFIFANAPERDIPSPDDENVIYYGEGTHDIGTLELKSGQTLYIGGDAVLFGTVKGRGDNICVRGRGILSGEKKSHDLEKRRERLFDIYDADGLAVEGIIMLDSPAWTLVTTNCENVSIENVKQICYIENSDGFDVCSCKHVTIHDCFVRNFDDNISLKAFVGDNIDIKMTDCVLWADCAHNMLIGPESKLENENTFADISFDNIDILEHKEYSDFFKGVMAIFCADKATFKNIEWNNIRVERMSHGRLFDFKYVDAYAKTFGKSVSDIRVKNVSCLAPITYRSLITGLDAEHMISGVEFENVTIHGIKLEAGDPSVDANEFTKNVTYR